MCDQERPLIDNFITCQILDLCSANCAITSPLLTTPSLSSLLKSKVNREGGLSYILSLSIKSSKKLYLPLKAQSAGSGMKSLPIWNFSLRSIPSRSHRALAACQCHMELVVPQVTWLLWSLPSWQRISTFICFRMIGFKMIKFHSSKF